jgi:GxxExxY protein
MNRQDAKDAKIEPDEALDELARAVLGAAIEVPRHLGPGYLESVYEEALAVELKLRGVPFERQIPIAVSYKGEAVGEGRLDFLVGNRLLVELKAVDSLAPIHKAQVISYLRATGCHPALLINFDVAVLSSGIRRIVLSDRRSPWRSWRLGG